MSQPTVAIVLTGAAARGAFQAGALSRIAPALERQGLRPSIYLGTSAGAINAALWGSYAHLPAEVAAERVLALWRSMDRKNVYTHPALSLIRDGLRILPGSLLGVGNGLDSLLDTRPLAQTAQESLDTDQIAANVASGAVDAVGVAATRIPPATGKLPTPGDPMDRWHISHTHSVVFLDTTLDASAVADPDRAVRVAPTTIEAAHVLASAAIPVAFPAVEVQSPADYAGWYVDGGVRLNAPLRPAVALGADHLVVIAAHATRYPARTPHLPGDKPDLADSAAMTLHSILADRVIEDLKALRTRNRWLSQGITPTSESGREYHHVALLEISPKPGSLAQLATDVLRSKGRNWWRESDSLALGRLLRGVGAGPGQQELLSYTFFDDEYFSAQIELGIAAADTALAGDWD